MGAIEGLAVLILAGLFTPLGVAVLIVGVLVIVAVLRPSGGEPDTPIEDDGDWWARQW